MKNDKNTPVGINPKFNREITERGKTDTTRIHIHDHSILWLHFNKKWWVCMQPLIY